MVSSWKLIKGKLPKSCRKCGVFNWCLLCTSLENQFNYTRSIHPQCPLKVEGGELMNDRDCKTCVYSVGWTEHDNGCTAWECDYINRSEAIRLYKEQRELTDDEMQAYKDMLKRKEHV